MKNLENRFYIVRSVTNFLTNKIVFELQGVVEKNEDLFRILPFKEYTSNKKHIWWRYEEGNLSITLEEIK